jgi:osmotically-inducible protein OsmY
MFSRGSSKRINLRPERTAKTFVTLCLCGFLLYDLFKQQRDKRHKESFALYGGLTMNKKIALISGLGIGAGLMYILDPEKGKRRRGLARDKVKHTMHETVDKVQKATHNISNHAHGISHAVTTAVGALFFGEQVLDNVLVARVRSKIGRVVSHPGAIRVTAKNGRVTLSGAISVTEAEALIKCVSSVRGVTEVEELLHIHARKNDLSLTAAG